MLVFLKFYFVKKKKKIEYIRFLWEKNQIIISSLGLFFVAFKKKKIKKKKKKIQKNWQGMKKNIKEKEKFFNNKKIFKKDR